MRKMDNAWISLNRIKKYKAHLYGTIIKFNNEKELEIPISFYSIDNQYCRATLLKAKLYEMKSVGK